MPYLVDVTFAVRTGHIATSCCDKFMLGILDLLNSGIFTSRIARPDGQTVLFLKKSIFEDYVYATGYT